ncbi:hypothetical protein WME73_48890 [Sorangium sp. So ce302]|uniref:hypothetical protein n=1 Tax=Sorangium sp. So ce302 TaxID=3133297 RepID=UPI003F633EA6
MDTQLSSDESDPSGQAAMKNFVMHLMCLMEIASFCAFPKLRAKATGAPTRVHVLHRLDAYLPIAREHDTREPGPQPKKTMSWVHAVRLRELFSEWTPSLDVPPEIAEESRRFLAGLGFPDPRDEIWDTWDGSDEAAGPIPTGGQSTAPTGGDHR